MYKVKVTHSVKKGERRTGIGLEVTYEQGSEGPAGIHVGGGRRPANTKEPSVDSRVRVRNYRWFLGLWLPQLRGELYN